MEADKLKKKLNGTILKGTKLRVEKARPKKRSREKNEESATFKDLEESRTRRPASKRKREEGVLPGYELPQERKVQRGWTEPATKPKGTKTKQSQGKEKEGVSKKSKTLISTFTDGPECLFRAKLSPNGVDMVTSREEVPSKKKKKQKATADREIVIHEFSNTIKHAGFLRSGRFSDDKKEVSGFIEGKGWVNENGDVVEGQPKQRSKKGKSREEGIESSGEAAPPGTKTRSAEGVDALNFAEDILPSHPKHVPEDPDETSSSGSSSESEDESTGEEPEVSTTIAEQYSEEASNKRTLRSSSVIRPGRDSKPKLGMPTDVSSHILPTLTVSSPSHHTPVHPLEALFKRPPPSTKSTPRKPPALEVKTSFSFFEQADNDGDNELESQEFLGMPQTPFTQHDLQHRLLRSAAPTPDTAAPGRSGFGAIWGNTPDGGDDDVSSPDEDRFKKRVGRESFDAADSAHRGSPGATGSGSGMDTAKGLALEALGSEGKEEEVGEEGQSEFAKWFWENRGETNRAWKKRRREAAKEQRQKENRKKVKQ